MKIWQILCFALILRLPLINGSFWLDEAAQALESSRAWADQLKIKEDFQPPLLHLITAAAVRISTAEWWLRLWSALLPGLGSIFFSYKIAELLNQKSSSTKFSAGLVALLMATNSFHIYYSQELRPYALTMMWSTLSWLILLKIQILIVNKRSWSLIGFLWVAANILGMYSSYLFPFLIIGQIYYLLTQKLLRASLFKWLKWLVMTTILFLPWLPKFSEQLTAGQLLRTSLPGWENVVATPQLKVLALVFAKFLFGVSDLSTNYFYIIFTVLLIVLLSICLFKFRKKISNADYQLMISWFVIPLVLIWLTSFFVPIIQAKRVIFLLPGFYLFIVQLLSLSLKLAKTNTDKITPLIILTAMFFLNIFSTIQYWLDPKLQRENWRELYTQINRDYDQDTPKLFVFDAPFAPWVWYGRVDPNYSGANEFSLGNAYAVNNQTAFELARDATDNFIHQKVLYFDYLTDLSDPNQLVTSELIQHGYQPTDLLNYPQIGFVRLFEKSSLAKP